MKWLLEEVYDRRVASSNPTLDVRLGIFDINLF